MSSSILDQPVPEINATILQQTLYKLILKALQDLASEATAKAKKKKKNDFYTVCNVLIKKKFLSNIFQIVLQLTVNKL